MSAVTGAVIGLAGAGASAIQAVQQNKLAKAAKKAQDEAAARLRSLTETNALKGVGVPTKGAEMAMDQVNQQAADAVSALQGTGAAGVIGGVAGLSKSVRDASLDVAAQLDESIYRRDLAVAQEQSRINKDALARQEGLDMLQLEGAQKAQRDAEYNRNMAIGNIASSLSSGIKSLGDTDKFDYTAAEKAATNANGVVDQKVFEAKLREQGATEDQIKTILGNLAKLTTKP